MPLKPRIMGPAYHTMYKLPNSTHRKTSVLLLPLEAKKKTCIPSKKAYAIQPRCCEPWYLSQQTGAENSHEKGLAEGLQPTPPPHCVDRSGVR
jgi:hypothetical protein